MGLSFVYQHERVRYTLRNEDGDAFGDERLIPFFLSTLLLAVQVLYMIVGLVRLLYRCRRSIMSPSISRRYDGLKSNLRLLSARSILADVNDQVRVTYGGYAILGFLVIRLCLSLLLLKLESEVFCDDEKRLPRWLTNGTVWYCANDSMSMSAAFAFMQSFLSLFGPQRSRSFAAKSHILVVNSLLAVYVYRDLWPLATYTLEPIDREQDMLWYKIAVISVLGLVIPLFMPYHYIPVDPLHPLPKTNPEQTASWISALTYSYLDPLISLANNVPHLRHDQLPPLADYDYAEYLARSSFPFIDPSAGGTRRHIFFGLFWYFRKEYTIAVTAFVVTSCLTFTAPIGINKTLAYLENGTMDATIKPWFWILLMLVGPLLHSVTEHWNLFVQTKIRVRIQAVLTQLVFEQSLRMRVKAEMPSDASIPSASELLVVGANEVVPTPSLSDTQQPDDVISTPSTAQVLSVVSAPVPAKKSAGDAENLIGKINNLVSSDLDTIVEGTDLFSLPLFIPLQIILSIVFLYKVLGWSAILGLLTMVATGPIGGYTGKIVHDMQIIKMKLTDARVQSISEAVGVLRMIKMFGWEGKMSKQLAEKREEELAWLWKTKAVRLAGVLTSLFIPTLAMLVTYAAHTMLMKEDLTASKIFSSMAVFTILQNELYEASNHPGLLIEAKVSLDRINEFICDAELLDKFSSAPVSSSSAHPDGAEFDNNARIGFKNATFSWSKEDRDGTLTPSSRTFRLRINGELFFKPNCINLIIGPTGVGKTSVLMALLGEMHFIPSVADSWFNLPRAGGIAYAAQESWVQNATIKQNILFGSQYDEERYRKVIRQCALERDLELLDAGDHTEVGERGLTLSGGQKARVTLARTIYSSASIILLDDILAALDVHTSAWIVDQCLQGDLIKGRTVILVTHNIALAGPKVKEMFGGNLGPSDKKKEEEQKPSVLAETPETAAAALSEGKLVVAEEIVEGHIKWKSMQLLLSALGGNHPITFFLIWLSGMIIAELLLTLQPWFLGVWGSQYEKMAPSDVNLAFYIPALALLVIASITVTGATYFYFQYQTIGASRIIHEKLVDSVFTSTLRWLDETPTARIIARCTQDIRSVDGPVTYSVIRSMDKFIGMLAKLAAIVFFTPVFVFPGTAVGLLGAYFGNRYLRTQLSVKREMSNARSPILAHFSEALHGLVSIRAYGAEAAFARETYRRTDHYSRTARVSWAANRWIGFRIDALGAVFTSGLAFYLVYGNTATAANAGFSLTMSVGFCGCIFMLIRMYNDLEVQANSLERIQGYIDIEHEPNPTKMGEPPAAWPTSGDIRVVDFSARYSKSGPKVLHDLTFHIASGERVGVVGRTGSGKSSLTLALLRCILTEGTVYYDGVATDNLNLDALRSNITIIPQVPELLSGTLRQNLDPFEQNDDATLNNALRASGLFSLQEDSTDVRLTLDSNIAGAGANLSIGQRQIIALARAMVRGSKLLILDEATSAIDYKTDAVIQSILRSQLGSDVTVITIAHRLQTIMDADKIMVLDAGRMVEFDSPKNLLAKSGGAFKTMVDGSGEKSLLYSFARAI
ncbi:P-loop containing nucleoside triphosphate hydrolase protein [Agrocybe pediades]|nr:P-loop containing nucleoside triphosphate hydrolase protein [Agrocybe pediades]